MIPTILITTAITSAVWWLPVIKAKRKLRAEINEYRSNSRDCTLLFSRMAKEEANETN